MTEKRLHRKRKDLNFELSCQIKLDVIHSVMSMRQRKNLGHLQGINIKPYERFFRLTQKIFLPFLENSVVGMAITLFTYVYDKHV